MPTYRAPLPNPTAILPWLIWAIGGMAVLVMFLLQTSLSVMVDALKADFATNALGVSLLSSSFFYTYLVLQIPSGLLVDRYGARWTLSVSLLLSAVACLLFAGAKTLAVAEASRILLGLATAPIVVTALYLAARWFSLQQFALLAGLTETLGMLGGALGEALVAQGVHRFGWRATMVVCAVVVFSLGVSAVIWVRDTPRCWHDRAVDAKASPATGWQPFFQVLALPQAWINGLCCGLLFSFLAAFAGFWCVPYLLQRFPVSLEAAASASACLFAGAALGAPLLGWYSDRLGTRRPLLLGVTAALCGLFLLMLYLPTLSFSGMVFLLFIMGIGSGIYVLPFAIMRDISSEDNRATAMGFTNMLCILLGAPVLQPLIGWLLDRSSHHGAVVSLAAFRSILWLFPGVLGLAFVSALLIKETYCGRR